ncbi:MAG TPA: hypothetical protein VGF94_24155 [Kofleriaceae bacterium]|jgi:hypothetical protein
MRDRTEIERHIFHARDDLEQRIGALRQLAREKVANVVRIERKVLVIAGIMLASLATLLIVRRVRR